MEEHLNKLREERIAREEARIQKLREINLKKYPRIEPVRNGANHPANAVQKIQPTKTTSASQSKVESKNHLLEKNKHVKNNFPVNNTSKRPITAPVFNKTTYTKAKPKIGPKNCTKIDETNATVASTSNGSVETKIPNSKSCKVVPFNQNSTANGHNHVENKDMPIASTSNASLETKVASAKSSVTLIGEKQSVSEVGITSKVPETITEPDQSDSKVLKEITKTAIVNPKIFTLNNPNRNTLSVPKTTGFDKPKTTIARKSMLPKLTETSKESVFDRLYKPKYVAKKAVSEVDRLKTDPEYLKKMIKTSHLIMNKHHTVFEQTKMAEPKAPRRSISAVHFKRISKSELGNCIHKWSSIGDKINEVDLQANEDEKIKEDKMVSAIKSERKKVTFMTPVSSSFNTPMPEEMQRKLKSWLQKRGKSLDAYHHLQCFGINHMKTVTTPRRILSQEAFQTPTSNFDEENKENIALDSDTDDGSYADTMNEPQDTLSSDDKIDIDNWRRASIDSESLGFVETPNLNDTTLTSGDTLSNVNDVLIGALNDLTSLLREGFEWQQAARWLRSIRERFPHAPRTASYWECRAALEDSRGDLPASLQCWEEALVKGTERSVAETCLDQLLEKFMQLKISPKSGAPRTPDPKLVNVKNVFKSSIIRFAVQAKLRRQSEVPVYTVTPVRRSARLSHCPLPRTPLRLCDTVQQATTIAPQHIFKPNEHFVETP